MGGFRTDSFADAQSKETTTARWQKAHARIAAGTMPPPGTPAVDPTLESTFGKWLQSGMFENSAAVAEAAKDCGVTPPKEEVLACDPAIPDTPTHARVWRLTHSQYDQSIQDILGVAANGEASFETDAGGNSAEALRVGLNQGRLYQKKSEDVAMAATANLQQLLGCPQPPADNCVKSFISTIGKKLWRQPLTATTETKLFNLYKSGKDQSNVRTGVRMVLEALLQSPGFLYRYELGPDTVAAGKTELTPYEIAAQLSYQLTGSAPDAELLAAADSGKIKAAEEIERQAIRLLASDRAKNTFAEFFVHLTGVDKISTLTKSPTDFPAYNQTLATNMRDEVVNFVKHVTWSDDGTLATLLTAPYTFTNTALANIYGVTPPAGTGFQKTALNPEQRSGLLTQLGLMSVLADDVESNPLHRGLFVRQELLCHPLPPPPPEAVDLGVPPIDPKLSNKERFARHSKDPNCASCHKLIDSIGFSFENYNAIGRYRTMERGFAIDNAGEVTSTKDANGSYRGVPALGQMLAKSSQVKECVATQFFKHSFGREASSRDVCNIKQLSDTLLLPRDQLQKLIITNVKSDAFRYREK